MKLLVEMNEKELDLYRKMVETVSTPLAIKSPTELAAALIESINANSGIVHTDQNVSADFAFNVIQRTTGRIDIPSANTKISITIERGN